MRGLLLLLAVTLAVGCRAPRQESAPDGSRTFDLTAAERDFSEALADYARGLLHEKEHGSPSAEALADFLRAVEHDPHALRLYRRAAEHEPPGGRLPLCERACRENPRSFLAQFELARQYEAAGRADDAAAHFRAACGLMPSNVVSRLALAGVLFTKGRHRESLAELRKGAGKAQSPGFFALFAWDATARLLDEGDAESADAYLQLYLRLAADCASTNRSSDLLRAGALLERSGHEDKAVEYYLASTRSENPVADSFLRLGMIQARTDRARAIETLARGSERHPENLSILFCVAEMNADEKRYAAAIAACERIEAAAKRTAQKLPASFFIVYASSCERAGRVGTAAEVIKRCFEECPESGAQIRGIAESYYETGSTAASPDTIGPRGPQIKDELVALVVLGTVYLTDKDYEDAISVFEKVAAAGAEDGAPRLSATFYLNYGSACERSGQFDRAERIFRDCLAVYPDAHQVLNYLAYMWAEKGVNLDNAMVHVSRALESEPDNGAYVDTLGWIYFQQKKYPEALKELERAHDLVKDDPTISDHLGDGFCAMKRIEQAVEMWKKSFLGDAENRRVEDKLRRHGVDTEALRKDADKKSPDAGEQDGNRGQDD